MSKGFLVPSKFKQGLNEHRLSITRVTQPPAALKSLIPVAMAVSRKR